MSAGKLVTSGLLRIFVRPAILTLDEEKRDSVWRALRKFVAERLDPTVAQLEQVPWMGALYEFTRTFELEIRDAQLRVKPDSGNILATLTSGSRFLKGHKDAESLILKAVMVKEPIEREEERVVTTHENV